MSDIETNLIGRRVSFEDVVRRDGRATSEWVDAHVVAVVPMRGNIFLGLSRIDNGKMAEEFIARCRLKPDNREEAITNLALQALSAAEKNGGFDAEHPDHTLEEWRHEVGADLTRSSYWSWVSERLKLEDS